MKNDWRFWINNENYITISYRGELCLHEPNGSLFRDKKTIHNFNIKTNDKKYWYDVKSFLKWLSLGLIDLIRREFIDFTYKELRRAYHQSKIKSWEDVLDKQVLSWVWNELNKESKDLPCCDNFRAARMDKGTQMRRFRKLRRMGCCGSMNWKAKGPDGKMYLLGFNYGH